MTTPTGGAHDHDHVPANDHSASVADRGQLGKITIGMSGGGTRAAGFHLGMLSYLHRRDLLDDVIITASASGGSIVNSTYAMSQARGQSFPDYHAWLIRKLRSAKMMEWVLEEFTEGTPQTLSKRRSMVAALADIYDRYFFDGCRFGELLAMRDRAEQDPGATHLEEVIINAADFRTGLGFRFQLHDPVGNGPTHLEPEHLRHARLADIMAASSCLPGGLEPFYFPEDFVWDGDEAKADAAEIKNRLASLDVEAVPLMDGGIYDNQGLESLMLAVVRRGELGKDSNAHHGTRPTAPVDDAQRSQNEFDLLFQYVKAGEVPEPPGAVIISDAPQSSLPVYRSGYGPDRKGEPLQSAPPPPDSGMRIKGFLRLWRVFMGVFALSAVALLLMGIVLIVPDPDVSDSGSPWLAVFGAFVPLAVILAAMYGLWHLRMNIRAALGGVDDVLDTEGTPRETDARAERKTWNYLSNLRFAQLTYVLKLRLSSLVSLANDIFFIRTRILSYMVLNLMPAWKEQLITNAIFDVGTSAGGGALRASEAMQRVVAAAAAMPTAFWFDHPDDLPKLVAAGQMDMCLNLVGYLERKKERTGKPLEGADKRLYDACLADWSRFLENPMVFVDEPPVIEGEGRLLTREEVRAARARRSA